MKFRHNTEDPKYFVNKVLYECSPVLMVPLFISSASCQPPHRRQPFSCAPSSASPVLSFARLPLPSIFTLFSCCLYLLSLTLAFSFPLFPFYLLPLAFFSPSASFSPFPFILFLGRKVCFSLFQHFAPFTPFPTPLPTPQQPL